MYLSHWDKKPRTIRLPLRKIGQVALRLGETDLDVLEQVFGNGGYDYAYPVEPKVIIDVGANIGMTTLFFAKKFPRARIIALEPEQSNFQLLRENCSALPNVTLLNAALWSEKGPVRACDPAAPKWAISYGPALGSETGTIPGLSMVDLLADYDVRHVDILKLDIEGAEREVFSHQPDRWLSKVGVIAIELHDRFVPGSSKSFYHAIRNHNFSQSLIGESVFIELHQ